MNSQLISDWTWFTVNVRPWFLTIFSAGTFAIAVRAYSVWRKGRTDDAKLAIDAAKLDLDGDKGIRDHYAAELSSLREQIQRSGDGHAMRYAAAEERHQTAMKKADERFDAAQRAADEREAQCEEKVAALRIVVGKLTDEVAGLRRLMGQTSRSAIVLAATTPSIPIQEAADRAATALGEADDRLNNLPHTKEPA